MRERFAGPASSPGTLCTVDVAVVTALDAGLGVLLARGDGATPRARWSLPHAEARPGESLEKVAARLARSLAGQGAWLEQVGAFTEGRHPADTPLSVGYVALAPANAASGVGGMTAWFPLGSLPPLLARQAAILAAATERLRARVGQAPIAFHLLPATFTLSELQRAYELMMGRRLQKASFRRALQAAWLVEPTNAWRGEGRGRPAQLFRYAPRKRRRTHRGVRFDFLSSAAVR